MAKPNNNLPQDIIDQILTCLPVKSLMRFKCVCKSWCSLFTSPQFTRYHLERILSQNPKTIDLKLLIPLRCGCRFKSLDLEKPFDEGAAVIRQTFPPKTYYRILGSCHGLICLGLETDLRYLTLWNPLTGESNELPKCNLFPRKSIQCNYYGFGYDSSSDDYKVVIGTDRKIVIFSLAKNSWRMIHEAESIGNICYRGVYSNGALHWQDGGIFAFDLKMERFRLEPGADPSILGRRLKLFGLGETLYCIKRKNQITNNSLDVLEFWLTENYRFQGSWTKVLSFPASNVFRYFLMMNFLGISKGNQVITDNGEDIIRFDAEGKIVDKIRKCYSPGNEEYQTLPYFSNAITYMETLVSPNRSNL